MKEALEKLPNNKKILSTCKFWALIDAYYHGNMWLYIVIVPIACNKPIVVVVCCTPTLCPMTYNLTFDVGLAMSIFQAKLVRTMIMLKPLEYFQSHAS